MSVDDQPTNPTSNRPFEDVLASAISRRKVMTGGLAAAATTMFALPGTAHAKNDGKGNGKGNGKGKGGNDLVGFSPAINVGGPNPTISDDYQYQVVIPWGTPLYEGVPELDATDPASNGSANQERQIGIGHDGMWFFADDADDDEERARRGNSGHDDGLSNRRGMLVLNHEFGSNNAVIGKSFPDTLEDVRMSQAAHGISVVELANIGGTWDAVVPSARNRRITVNTPVEMAGPAAGSPLLDTPAGNGPAGTLNNCANGYTPWGTYLTCEENVNGYFGANAEYTPTPAQERYGFTPVGFGYGWHVFDERWDLTNPDYTNEENRFGWVVEIDPNDPDHTAVKRTALGRVKHEGAATTVGRGGRVVVYMGDDQRFDYIYKFVSARNWKSMMARGQSPLDEGTLYVARFDDDFTGEWMPLTPDNPALAGWSLDEILVFTRMAADVLGATPMDRAEWTTIGRDQSVYCTLTNNTNRTADQVDAANPLGPNPDGHIIRWRDSKRHTGTDFTWDIFVLAKDTRLENGGDETYEFTDPDGLWADPDGRLFIATDGGQPNGRNNQLVIGDIAGGGFRRLFSGVTGDEITGITTTPDRRTLFINTQHPGNGSAELSNFPVPGAGGPEVPRDATFAITRKDGGIVGS